MGSSWTQNYYHAVFSTKDRIPFLTEEYESRVHAFIGGILKDLDCTPIAINGMPNHVHLLTRYPSDLSHARLLQHVKGRSSKWIGETFPALRSFFWQEGYGGFTVSKSMVETVERYIRNQKQHHLGLSFEDEFIDMLERAGEEFDRDEIFK